MLNLLQYVRQQLWDFLKPAVELTVIKVNPVLGDRLNVYQGGKAEIFVVVKDNFYGNTVKNIDLDVETSSHLTLDSCRFDSESGCHVVTVDCNKEGTALLSLTSATFHGQLQHELKIIPAPLYPENCRVSYTEEECVFAGQVVKWQLQLYDICNNPFPLKLDYSPTLNAMILKIDDELRADDETSRRKEENSLNKFIMSDSHICFVEWQPVIAGNRSIAVSINGIEMGKRFLQVKVEPGPLVAVSHIPPPTETDQTVATVSHIPPTEKQIVSYLSQERKVNFKGLDKFGNTVPINPEHWYLEVCNKRIIGTKVCSDLDGMILQFVYRFDEKGTYPMDMKSSVVDENLKVPDSFVVKVISAPLDHTKCRISLTSDRPIFEGSRSIGVAITLLDCTANPYSGKKLEDSSFQMKVDRKLISDITINRSTPGELVLFANTDISLAEDTEKCTIEVLYKGEVLGDPICEYVVHIHPYKKVNYLRRVDQPLRILCKVISPSKLIGEDKAPNIQNINRVIQMTYPDLSDEIELHDITEHNANSTMLLLKKFGTYMYVGYRGDRIRDKICRVLSLFVEGSIHYRDQAFKFDKNREKWKEKAGDAYSEGKYDEARECKTIKEMYAELMNESHRKASDAIFQFYNYIRSNSEIDLHGQLVANEKKLEAYRKQLLRKKDEKEVEGIVNRERMQRDEAIRHLRKKIQGLTTETRGDWLEIIVGAGHHSRHHQQNIRPKVEEFLKKQDLPSFIESNEGALLITFTEYTGPEPCVANFYCKKCKSAWESNTSWKGFWQKCNRCDRRKVESECNPFKLRARSTSRKKGKRGASFTREDHIKLCGKCQQRGGEYCGSM